ncbi:MAG: hypothetical protein LCH38_10265 [Proteobacteria bacterium]|nr:hypothetical protein [Pseudomonadota bacterium]
MKRMMGLSLGIALAAAALTPSVEAAPVGSSLAWREAAAAPLEDVASRRHVRRGRNNAAVAGAIIGGAIIGGAIIANSQRRRYYEDGYYYREPAYPQPYYYPQRARPYSYGEVYPYPQGRVIETRPYYHRRDSYHPNYRYERQSPPQYWENRNEK